MQLTVYYGVLGALFDIHPLLSPFSLLSDLRSYCES